MNVLQRVSAARPVSRWLARRKGGSTDGTRAGALVREPTTVNGIRRRKPNDLAACARLLRVVYSERHYPLSWPDQPRAWLSGEGVLDAWVAEHQGEMLGHVAISRVGLDEVSDLRWREITGRQPSELARVSRLFVRPRVRRQGIGGALLDVAVGEIRARGLEPVLVVSSASTDAISLFEDRGWRLLSMDPWRAQPDRLRICCYALPSERPGG